MLEGDTAETLSARILEAEHRIYPRAVRAMLEGRCRRRGPSRDRGGSVNAAGSLRPPDHGRVDVVTADALQAKLARGRPLTVKVGFDPTAPDIHLGHTVLMRKMRHFQDLGHRVIFVIGDFTGMIGDPTGKLEDAPAAHARGDRGERRDLQAAGLQDPRSRRRPRSASTASGSGALGRTASIRLAATYNVARMLERRDFRQRFEAGQPISRPRVPLPAGPGLRLGGARGRRRARRHRPALQPQRRPRHHAGLRPRAAGGADDAAARGHGRRREDVEEPRQLRRRHRAPRRDVRQADDHLGRADVALLRAAHGPPAREIEAEQAAGRPMASKMALGRRIVADFHGRRPRRRPRRSGAACTSSARRRASSPGAGRRRARSSRTRCWSPRAREVERRGRAPAAAARRAPRRRRRSTRARTSCWRAGESFVLSVGPARHVRIEAAVDARRFGARARLDKARGTYVVFSVAGDVRAGCRESGCRTSSRPSKAQDEPRSCKQARKRLDRAAAALVFWSGSPKDGVAL